MTVLPVPELQDYRLPVPEIDGHKAVTLKLNLSGGATLDRTSAADVALLEAARLGEPVRLIVVTEAAGKGFRLQRKPDGEPELAFSLTLRVVSVEAAELA